MSDPNGEPDEALLSFIRAHQASKYLAVASITVLMYDWALTLDEEVHYIWRYRPRWTLAKTLFALNRWLIPPFFAVHLATMFEPYPSQGLCGYAIYRPLSLLASIAIAELVLVLRVWALYENSRPVLFFLIFVYVGSVGSSVIVIIIALLHPEIMPSPVPGIVTGCLLIPSKEILAPFVSGLILEAILFGMTLYKVYRMRAHIKTPLIACLFRDGTIYFFVVLIAVVFLLASLPFTNIALPALASNYIVAVAGVSCSRLLLSLHGLFSSPPSNPSTRRTRATTTTDPSMPLDFGSEEEVTIELDTRFGHSDFRDSYYSDPLPTPASSDPLRTFEHMRKIKSSRGESRGGSTASGSGRSFWHASQSSVGTDVGWEGRFRP